MYPCHEVTTPPVTRVYRYLNAIKLTSAMLPTPLLSTRCAPSIQTVAMTCSCQSYKSL